MKRLIFLIALLAFVAGANDIIFFDTASYPVTNRVTRYAPSLNEPDYYGVAGALIITNLTTQKGAGVTMSNLTSWCVVDGQAVRLMSAGEISLVNSNANYNYTNGLEIAKTEARVYATNVINGTDGLSIYLRAMGEANWFYLNYIRTNDGKVGLTKSQYKNTIDANIDAFGR